MPWEPMTRRVPALVAASLLLSDLLAGAAAQTDVHANRIILSE